MSNSPHDPPRNDGGKPSSRAFGSLGGKRWFRWARVLVPLIVLAVPILLFRFSSHGPGGGSGATLSINTGGGTLGAYYLSLGDSLGFGFQPGTVQFTHGYTEDFATKLRAKRSDLQVVNYSCPGETTRTMISGGCPSPLTKDTYPGPQLTAATAFLNAHKGEVSPITVSIGANDALPNLQRSGQKNCPGGTCPTAQAVGADGLYGRVGTILAKLRAAAPDAEILLLQPYDPLAKEQPATVDATRALDARLATVAKAHRVNAVDGFTPINIDPPSGQDICSLTFYCSKRDVHPTDLGYQLLGNAFWKTSRYGPG